MNASRKDTTGTTFFVYDGWNVVAEYRRIQTLNVLQRRYVWGEDLSGSLQGAGGVGGLVMVSEFASGNEGNYCYHYDGNGNLVEITDELATLRASYRYDAYGRTLSAVGSYGQPEPLSIQHKARGSIKRPLLLRLPLLRPLPRPLDNTGSHRRKRGNQPLWHGGK